MRFNYKSLPVLLILTLTGCDNQFGDLFWPKEDEEVVCDTDTTAVSFKKVAYWSVDEDYDKDDLDAIDFSALTHIIYSNVNVNSDGSIAALSDDDEDALQDLVEYAQLEGVKVGVSLGDGNDNNFNTIAESTSLTKAFVSDVVDFIDDYELDGVDMNWQTIDSSTESDNLEELLDELQEDLSEDGKFLSMAVTSGEDDSQADNVDSDLFEYVDFVNVMAFDSTDKDDFHSSFEDAEEAITYWTGRCLIQNKLVLGVPFYSNDNDEDVDESLSYDYIVDDNTDYACVDESEGRNYNGIPTIIDKTSYALLYAGGIMMKSLEQDAYENPEYLLLNVINETSNGDYVDICD